MGEAGDAKAVPGDAPVGEVAMGDIPEGDVMTGAAVPGNVEEDAAPGVTEYVGGGGTVDCPGVKTAEEDDGICAVKGAAADAEVHLEFDVEGDEEVDVEVGDVVCVVPVASEEVTVSFTLPEEDGEVVLDDGDSEDAEEDSEDEDSSTGVGNCIRCASAGVAIRHHTKAKLRNIFAVFTKNPLSTGLVNPIFIPS